MRELNAHIRIWIETWYGDPKPYISDEIADQVLESIAAYGGDTTLSRYRRTTRIAIVFGADRLRAASTAVSRTR